jgi:hypothetical protein
MIPLLVLTSLDFFLNKVPYQTYFTHRFFVFVATACVQEGVVQCCAIRDATLAVEIPPDR